MLRFLCFLSFFFQTCSSGEGRQKNLPAWGRGSWGKNKHQAATEWDNFRDCS